MTLFLHLSFMNLLNNLNDIHGKPKQLVVKLTACLAKCVSVCSRVLCVYLGGLSSIINIPLVVYFVYDSKPTFDLDVQSLRSIFQKNPWPRIIDIGPAICKLLRFLQVQSEHERTLIKVV